VFRTPDNCSGKTAGNYKVKKTPCSWETDEKVEGVHSAESERVKMGLVLVVDDDDDGDGGDGVHVKKCKKN